MPAAAGSKYNYTCKVGQQVTVSNAQATPSHILTTAQLSADHQALAGDSSNMSWQLWLHKIVHLPPAEKAGREQHPKCLDQA